MPAFRLTLAAVLGLWPFASQAATVRDVDLGLSFQGHSYLDVEIYDLTGSAPELVYATEWLTEDQDIWGLPRIFADFAIGDLLRFSARIQPEATIPASTCQLGPYDCSAASEAELAGDDFGLFFGVSEALTGSLLEGGSIIYAFLPEPVSFAVLESGFGASWTLWRASFTVVDILPQPASIPLPASALLIPTALAGLQFIRRRNTKRVAGNIASSEC